MIDAGRGVELGGQVGGPHWTPRLAVFIAVAVTAGVVLGGRLAQIQVGEAAQLATLARANQIRRTPLEAERGVIFDRHGRQLVVNEPAWSLEVVPGRLPTDPRRLRFELQELAAWSGESTGQVDQEIQAGAGNPYQPVVVTPSLDQGAAELVAQEAGQLPAVQLEQRPVRTYYDPAAFAPLLGYTGLPSAAQLAAKAGYLPDEQVGQAGLEAGLQGQLRGTDGWRDVQVDATGQPLGVVGERPPLPGHNVYLTVDASLQQAVTTFLQHELRRVGRLQGAAIVVQPSTGEVLALASEPSYDDNLFTHGISQRQYQGLLEAPGDPLFNVAIAGQFPPGSTFKMITASAGLQDGKITPATQLDCPSSINYDGWNYANWAGGDMGRMNVVKAIAVSCDTFFYQVAARVGDSSLASWARNYGYGATTGLQLPGQAPGVAPDSAWKQAECGVLFTGAACRWQPGDTITMGIGQSYVLTTPLIQAMYVSAIGNGGRLLEPTLVAQVRSQSGRVLIRAAPRLVRRLPISAANLQTVKAGMGACLTAPYGTGFLFRDEGFRYDGGCKTGSAQYANNAGIHGWFVFFAPYRQPEIAIVVLIDGGGEGHEVAEPVAVKIADYYFAHRRQILG